jgi:hypothetical protein
MNNKAIKKKRKLRQKNNEFEIGLGYIVRPVSKKKLHLSMGM